MTEYQKDLIKEYKHKVKKIGIKRADDLALFLLTHIPVKQIDFKTEVDVLTQNFIISNVSYQRKFKEKSLMTSELEFLAYKVLKNGVGKKYYKNYIPTILDNHQEGVYVVLEKKTNYISCNNNQLLLELMVERGVSEYDFKNNTLELMDYLSKIEMLEKYVE